MSAREEVIPGVPAWLTRDEYLSLVRGVGLDTKNLFSLTFEPNAVRAQVYALDENGRKMIDSEGEPLMHDVVIEVRR